MAAMVVVMRRLATPVMTAVHGTISTAGMMIGHHSSSVRYGSIVTSGDSPTTRTPSLHLAYDPIGDVAGCSQHRIVRETLAARTPSRRCEPVASTRTANGEQVE